MVEDNYCCPIKLRFNVEAIKIGGYTTNRGAKKEGTNVIELSKMACERANFCESDIQVRHKEIIEGFIGYLRKSKLLL